MVIGNRLFTTAFFTIRAVEAEQLKTVKLILSTQTGQNTISIQKNSTKETALMIACQKGLHEIIQVIMEISNIDINLGLCDKESRNIFHHAAKDDEILSVMINICQREVCISPLKVEILFSINLKIWSCDSAFTSRTNVASKVQHKNIRDLSLPQTIQQRVFARNMNSVF